MENSDRTKDKFILRWAKHYRAVKELGGKCIKCGEKDLFTLDFHHKNPKEKEFGICQARQKDWGQIKNEIDKCILLCRKCHQKFHLKEVEIKFYELFDKIKEKADIVHLLNRPKLDEDYIYELLKKRVNITNIAKILNKSVSSIQSVAKRLETKYGRKLFLTRDDYNADKEKINVEELIKFYNDGLSVIKMSEKFGCATSTLYNKLRRLKAKNIIQ